MWQRESAWFDLAVIFAVFAFGNVIFGRFVEHRPRLGRVAKVMVISALYVWIAQGAGRFWAGVFLGIGALAALIVHGWWLPRHGRPSRGPQPSDGWCRWPCFGSGGSAAAAGY
jgi:hypothetical protein